MLIIFIDLSFLIYPIFRSNNRMHTRTRNFIIFTSIKILMTIFSESTLSTYPDGVENPFVSKENFIYRTQIKLISDSIK